MKYQISKVAVLRAGILGAGIAALIAGIGIPVYLMDMVPKSLTEEEKAKGLTFESIEIRNKFPKIGKEKITDYKNKSVFHKDVADLIQIGNLEDNMDMISDCDWVIEVIVENLESKKIIMKEISKYRKEVL